MSSSIEIVNLATNTAVKKMTNHQKIKEELEKFGLSKNQAELYLLLVAHKELRIQEIVKLSGIPRSSVYDNLKALFELGIAEEIVENNYKKIRPYSIGTMRHGLDEKIFHLHKLSKSLDNLEKSIKLKTQNGLPNPTIVRFYKGRSGARQLYWNTLRARSTAYVYSDWGRGRYVGMRFYESFVSESRERNIKEKVLINSTVHVLESIRKYNYPGSPISRTKIEDIRAIDKKKILIKGDTLIYDDVYAQVYLKNMVINGFEIESRDFTETQRSIFETLWKTAKPISKLL